MKSKSPLKKLKQQSSNMNSEDEKLESSMMIPNAKDND